MRNATQWRTVLGMETKTKADAEHKVTEAVLLLRRARNLLDAAHIAYRDAADTAPLTADEFAEWRKVIDLAAPLDQLHYAGALDR